MAQFGFMKPDATMRSLGNYAMKMGGMKAFRGSAWDAATSSGMAYLVGELEKIDPKIREPLTSLTWQRDIVAKTGGGWVEHTSTFDVEYATSGANGNSIVAPGATAIPIMQVNTNKNLFKVSTFMHAMHIPFIYQAKLKQIGRNLEDLLDKGIKLNYNKAEFSAAYGKFSQIPAPERIEIAFAGHSNVGKSTLINKLFNRKNLARVSSVPGKTATINFYGLENLYFVDLPGYGYAKVSKSEKERWAGLIEGYLSSDRDIRLVFMLVDMRHAPTKDDIHMINYLIDTEMPFVLVLTKADKLNKTERAKRMEAFKDEIPCFEDIHSIPFSSQTFEGVEELRTIVEDIADDNDVADE